MAYVLRALLVLVAGLSSAVPAFPQDRVESNVIYGMYSGSALLMDVHYPTQPNGFGVVFVSGSGWRTVPDYSATPLKQSAQIPMYVPPLVAAGYTVFTLNHRATPGFRYPEVFSDVQRAIRFIRYNAAKYGIDHDRLGGAGGSSGAHLLSLSATMDAAGIPNDPDPINRQSAKLQCAVMRAAPFDLTRMTTAASAPMLAPLLGAQPGEWTRENSPSFKSAAEASPINYVSRDDRPFLLLHGDADQTVPFSQSQEMEAALKRAGVAVKLIRIEGADHGPDFPGAKNPPDYKQEMVHWFDTFLRKK